MRKLIIATTALAFLSSAFLAPIAWSPAFAQDSMSKGDASKDKMSKKTTKKAKKSSKMKSDDATKQ